MPLSIDDDGELVGPDPDMVDHLMGAMAEAAEEAVIKGVTTHADMLSALFTMICRFLRNIAADQSREDKKEIARVLSEMLMEFGVEDFN